MEQPKRLGDYEVLDKLGSGGMGEVYRVRNLISDRIEAMKVLLPDLVGRQDLATRFLREIKVLAALDHPNIAALRTAQTVDNRLVMIMELVEGQSLAQRVAQGPIAPGDALQVARQVLDALDYAHRQEVIHRDIKPANMMITPQGVVKLMDFGIARSTRDDTLTQAGVLTGSLSYISPEQINGGTPDARSDLYSLGVSLYEMVTGQLPFKADNNVAVMFAHLQTTPVPPIERRPALSPELNALVLKAIAKDPASRFQTAREFRDAVIGASAAAAGVPASAAATAMASVPTIPAIPAIAAMSNTPGTDDTARIPGAPPAAPGPLPSAPMPPPRRVQGGVRPILYVALGAFLLVAAVGAMAYYARMAEATPPNTSTTPLPAASTTPAPPPEPAPAATPESAAAVAPTDTAASTTPTTASTAPTPPESAPVAGAIASKPAAKASATQSSVKVPATDPAPAIPAERSAVTSTRHREGKSAPEPAKASEAAGAAEAALEETLDRLEAELDQLSARATAVNGTLDRLKAEQARAGYGLRGDMAARQQMLNTNLGKAEDALDRKDLARAERFKALAQSDLEALEKFIGR
jgi:hypothetical protein